MKETRRNWYLVRFLRNWKILLPVEIAGLAVAVAAVYLLPDSAIVTAVIVVGAVVFVGLLAYSLRSVTVGGDE